jgi:hypothetical protein
MMRGFHGIWFDKVVEPKRVYPVNLLILNGKKYGIILDNTSRQRHYTPIIVTSGNVTA